MNQTYLNQAVKEFTTQTNNNWIQIHKRDFVIVESKEGQDFLYSIILRNDLPKEDDDFKSKSKHRGFRCKVSSETKVVTTLYNLYSQAS